MAVKKMSQSCVIVFMVNGFDESETITLISILRQAGLCVKSVGLVSGLVGSIHGVWLMPDLTIADLGDLLKTQSISVVVLPESEQSLSRLKTDPRIHKLLRQIAAQKGQIAVGNKGMQFLTANSLQSADIGEENPEYTSCLLIQEIGQTPESFARDLIHRVGQLPHR